MSDANSVSDSYQEMISKLQSFMTEVDLSCQTMTGIGAQCVENMPGDQAAVNANGKVGECVQKIRGTFEEIQAVIQQLQATLQQHEELVNKGNSI